MCVSDSGRPGSESMDKTHDLSEPPFAGLRAGVSNLATAIIMRTKGDDLTRSKSSVLFSSLGRV